MEKINFTTKLHECCSTDELRPIMMCVHFMNGFAYASDSIVLIKQTLEYHSIKNAEFLEGKSIHKDNYKAIMQFEIAQCDDAGVSCQNSDGRVAFFEYYDRKGAEIPNFDSVLKPVGQKLVDFIGIRPESLAKLCKAMHSPDGSVRMQFQGIDKPVLVDVIGIENQWGIVMPTVLNDTLFSK